MGGLIGCRLKRGRGRKEGRVYGGRKKRMLKIVVCGGDSELVMEVEGVNRGVGVKLYYRLWW